MLDERAVVAEVVDVLARGALVRLAAAGDGVGTGRVERDGVALDDLGEIGADGVEVDLVGRWSSTRPPTSAGSTNTSGWPSKTVSPTATPTRRTNPASVAVDDVLHLHRLHHEQLLAGADRRRRRRRRSRRSCPAGGERTAVVPAGPSSVGGDRRAVAASAGRAAPDLPKSSTASGSTASTLTPASRALRRGRRLGVATCSARLVGRRGDELGDVVVDEAGRGPPGAHVGVGEDGLEERRRSSARLRRAARRAPGGPSSSASGSAGDGVCTMTLASSESKLALVR